MAQVLSGVSVGGQKQLTMHAQGEKLIIPPFIVNPW